MTRTEQILATLPGDVLANLRQVDQRWLALKQGRSTPPNIVREQDDLQGAATWDVIIGGGTLGIFLGAWLAQQGWRVILIEQGPLRGRTQEWNISRRELTVLVELDLLSEAELASVIATEYNPARISFHEGPEFWVQDVLNIGVDPAALLAQLKQKFLAAGGQLLEYTPVTQVVVHPDGVTVEAGHSITGRLFLDAMGHFSPIVQQARQGQPPDGVCLVVGSCAQGFTSNASGDLMASFTPIRHDCQYFWEAFPARDGRTTYLFTYVDARPERFSLEFLYEEYLQLLPIYQAVELAQLQFQRALFGLFPSYRQSPLPPHWHRILQVGDSSGSQSPLSFGGFGAMLRHLPRLSQGLQDALTSDSLDRRSLAWLQPYQPNLSVTWLFQQAMSVTPGQPIDPNQINQLLSLVFATMTQAGDAVLKPFLQDVVQFPALSRTLLGVALNHPQVVAQIIPHVGWRSLLDWIRHYAKLGLYSGLYPAAQFAKPWLPSSQPIQRYYYAQLIRALQYGTGNDYQEISSPPSDW